MTNSEIVRGIYDAMTRGDYDAVFARFHADVDVDLTPSGIPGAGRGRGHAAVREIYSKWRSGWETYDAEPIEVLAEGPRVLAILQITARSKGQGIELEGRFADLWTFEEGLVVAFAAYGDEAQARLAAGL